MRRRGFTIIELLVASALLGMLVTILTMIFNQSSIAWRIGIAGVSDLGDVRYTMGALRDVADNAFVYGSQKGQIVGLWDFDGNLHQRACVSSSVTANSGKGDSEIKATKDWFFSKTSLSSSTKPENSLSTVNVGSGDSGGSFNTYTVNVMSGGPANDINDWQAIWSYPDDPSEW